MGTSDKTSSEFGLYVVLNSDQISEFIMADKVLQEVTKVDRNSMQKVETEEKNVLPDAEAIRMEKEHEDFKSGINSFKKGSLKRASTIEKNSLPTKEDIAAEKAAN